MGKQRSLLALEFRIILRMFGRAVKRNSDKRQMMHISGFLYVVALLDFEKLCRFMNAKSLGMLVISDKLHNIGKTQKQEEQE